MADNRQRIILARPPATRRGLLAAGAAAPVLVGAATPAVRALPRRERPPALSEPVLTEPADRTEATRTPGRPGEMKRYTHHTGLPRRDLDVVLRGARIDTAVPTAGVTG